MPVEHRLVTLTAIDGEHHDAMLVIDERATRRRERATGRRTSAFHVHGIMGNFLVGTLRFLAPAVAREGVPVLVVETRMGNIGQLVGPGIFDRARLDLDAAARWLREEVSDELYAFGYSSGAALAIRWAANQPRGSLRGLVGLGTPWSLPAAQEARARRWGAEPSYERIFAEAKRVVLSARGDDADRLFVIERSRGPTRQPRHGEVYTYRTWWHSRGPRAEAAMTHLQIPRMDAPLLLVQCDGDVIVHPEEAGALAKVARRAGNHAVEVVMFDRGDHAFAGRELLAINAVTSWLRRHP